jgi:tetratricopeptide (TPR) repeat protein
MKKYAFIHAAFLTGFLFIPFSYNAGTAAFTDINAYKAKNAISCTPDRAELTAILENLDIPLLPGSGTYDWKIKTSSDSAQLYFNQGINTYYAFHIIESLASFKKAAGFDPDNPMVWWAQALAYGPNINDLVYSATPEALSATQKAVTLMDKASPVEQELIKAMKTRYSEDSTKTRESLNQAYTDAMKAVYEKYPDSADVGTLYADAMMLQHPWNFWNVNGTPKEWTPHIEEVLEKTIGTAPLHPGANHYYIHVMEPSPTPQKAMASADLLGRVTPGLAHLVHMPSHIYLRTGLYNKGAQINQEALNRFGEYSTLFPAVTGAAFLYYLHNEHMLVNCAMLAGRYNTSIGASLDLQRSIDSATLSTPPPMGSLIHYVYMAPVLINVRFEKWDSLLAMQQPDSNYVYANVLYRFGKGMAQAGKNDVVLAKEELAAMRELMKAPSLKIPMTPFSTAIDGALTASEMLDGFIALKENRNTEAIAHFTNAVKTESEMVYDEPRDWFLNPNQYLGYAYLKNNDKANAEKAFNKDLSLNAKNVWSLYGLQQSVKSKKKAAAVKKEFEKAAEKSDIDFAALYF